MLPGWSTNSLDGDAFEALPTLARLGYASLAITPDRHLLNPFADRFAADVAAWHQMLREQGMACVVETGARHLLDSLQKHEPTLLSSSRSDRQRRIDFLLQAIDLAAELGGQCVSLWSGVVRDAAEEAELWDRLRESLQPVLTHAAARGISIGFEPEPGMFVDTLGRFDQLVERCEQPDILRLTIDIGHLECMGEWPLADAVACRTRQLVNVHLDDMRPCIHDHLPLGSGVIDFPPLIKALRAGGYTGGLHAELPRQSHRWFEEARLTATFLSRLLDS
jgi:sugar phosphate isomerase/epimerase